MSYKILLIIITLFSSLYSSVFKIQTLTGDKIFLPCITSDWDQNEVQLVLWYRENSATPFYKLDSRNRPLFKAKHILSNDDPKHRIYFDILSIPPVLKISNVMVEDEGEYRCRVDYRKSRTQTSLVTLEVIVPPKEVVITDKNGHNLEGIVGPFNEYTNVVLICEARAGNPNPSLIWYKINILEVIIDDSFTIVGNGLVRNELNLRNLNRNDLMTKLTCRASNNGLYEPIDRSVIIDMDLKPLNVVILRPNTPVIAGKLAQFNCSSDGSRPEALISWFIDYKSLDNIESSVKNDVNTSLSIISFVPTIEQNGKQLICRAFNQRLTNSSIEDKFVLNIQFEPQIEISLNEKFQKLIISEGNDIQIDCKIKSNPMVDKTVWLFNGKHIANSENIALINSNQSLVLKNLTQNQSGKYQCMASNIIGNGVSDELTLSVKFSPVCKVGQKLHYSINRNIINKIKCSVESDPIENLKFNWFVNTSIESFELKTFDSNLTTSYANFIPKTIMDYVLLLCYAENSIGVQTKPCVYKLRIQNGPPESLRNCEITNRSLTILSVQCSAGSDGGLQQTFHLEVYDFNSSKIHSNHSSSQPMFFINDLIPKIQYKILIYSANVKGKSKPIVYNSVQLWSEDQKVAKVANPLMNSFIGIVASVVIVCLFILIVMRIRSYIYDDEYHDYYHKKEFPKSTQSNDGSNSEDSDEENPTKDQNLITNNRYNGEECVAESSERRLNGIKRLTNRLRSTKCKIYDLREAERIHNSLLSKPKKTITFATIDELSEDIEENSTYFLNDYSESDLKNDVKIESNINSTNSGNECEEQLKTEDKCMENFFLNSYMRKTL